MQLSLLKQAIYLLLAVAFCFKGLRAEDIYLEPDKFIEQSFDKSPEQKVVWLTKEVKATVEKILGHSYSGLRVRYWQSGPRTAWILEEIGKVKPITAGFVIENGKITDMQVLIYRESHGWEVRYPFFRDQFSGIELEDDHQLNKRIDGISGATLSVNALTKLSRIALYLESEVTKP